MPARFFTETDVATALTLANATAAVEAAFRDLAAERAESLPRRRVAVPGCWLHELPAGWSARHYLGLKCYTTTATRAKFLFWLYSGQTGELLAVLEADLLGRIRTAAATALATRFLANPGADSLGCIGTGGQAEWQIAAVMQERPVREVRVFGRDVERREAFAARLSTRFERPVIAVDSAAAAAREQPLVVLATTSRTPVVSREDLASGCHVTAMGGNHPARQELDPVAISGFDRIVCDQVAACRSEAGELIAAAASGQFQWDQAAELAQLVAGQAPGRSKPDERTLFKSVGVALEDVAAASLVYEWGLLEGRGIPLPF